MGVEVRAGVRERRLFEFLVSSRPQLGWRGGAAAAAASLAAHGAIVVAVVLATLLTAEKASTDPPSESVSLETIEAGAPVVASGALAVLPDARPGTAARTSAPAPADVREGTERLLRNLKPPTVTPEDIPVPSPEVLQASLRISEYDGIGQDSMLSAAMIFADHHERTAEELEDGPPSPEATPYTQGPELTNGPQMAKLLSRNYPRGLQEDGIGGRVLIWFLVDEYGYARRWLLKSSSGYRALDRAALKVASLMRFRPAINYDRHVAVWVVLPVTFHVITDDS